MSLPHSLIWIMLTIMLIAFRFLLYKNIFYIRNDKNHSDLIHRIVAIHKILVLKDSLYHPMNWAFLDCSHKGGIVHSLISLGNAVSFSKSLTLNSLFYELK